MVCAFRPLSCLARLVAVLGSCALLVSAGCSSSDEPTPAPPAAAPEENEGPGTTPTCADTAAATDAVFDFDPDGPDGQIHAYGVAVSDGVWVVYNRPGSAGAFDVYATKLSCAGVPIVAPVLLSQSDDNEVDPAAAWDDQTNQLLVVWSADQSASGKTPNLSLRSRLVSASGQPIGEVRPLDLQRKGAPVGGNVWMPQLATNPAGGFALVGTWGHDDAPGFQTFAQSLDAQGGLVGDGEDIGPDPASSHDAPVVAFAADGARVVAYSSVANDSPSGQGYDVWTKIGGAAPENRLPEGGHATIASGPSGAWIAAQDVAGRLDAAAPTKRKGLYQPAIAAGAVGASLVAYTKAANKAPLHAYRLGDDGAFVGAGVELSNGAAAYPLHLEAMKGATGGDVFFVAFQEGAGQTIRGKARFFRVP
jgi:hypothetical protein